MLAPIRIVIAGVDNFSRQFAQLERQTRQLSKNLTAAGTAMTLGVTTPLLAGAAASIKLGADFDYTMRKMMAKTTEAGVTFAQLRDQAKMLGATTQFSAQDAAAAMEMLGAAGWDTTQIFQGIPGVMSMAAASDVDMATAADIAVNTMSAFNLEAKEASRVADILATTANASAIGLVDIGESMKYAAPVARQFGASLEDTSAAVAFLGNIGIKGSMAGTNLATMFARLSAPTDEAATTLKNLGIQVADARGNMLPYMQILGQLGSKFETLTQQQRLQAIRDIFGLEAMKGAAPMIAEAGGAMAKLGQALNNVQPGAAQRMVDIMTGGATGSFMNFQSAVEGLGIAFAESGLLDAAADLATFLSGILGQLSSLDPAILKTITILAGFAAALGPLLVAAGAVVGAVSSITAAVAAAGGVSALLAAIWPVVAVVGAIVALGVALWQMRGQLDPLVQVLKAGLAIALGILLGLWRMLEPALVNVWAAFKNIVAILVQVLKTFWPVFAIIIAWMNLPLAGAILVIVGVFRVLAFVIKTVTDGWKMLFDLVGEFFSFLDQKMGGPFQKLLEFLGGKLPSINLGGGAGQTGAAAPAMPALPAVGGLGTAPAGQAAAAGTFSMAPMATQESKVVVDFRNMPAGVTAQAASGPVQLNYGNGLLMQGTP